MHIALLEDDVEQGNLLKTWLIAAGHKCDWFERGGTMIDALQGKRYDLLVLDWIVEDKGGDEVVKWLRENIGWGVPVLFVTVRDQESDVVAALKMGADDYLVKPVKQAEFVARVEALGRRAGIAKILGKQRSDFSLDETTLTVKLGSFSARLTPKEFDLAAFLLSHPGELLSREVIEANVWASHVGSSSRTVDIHISRLRRKLELDGRHGYKLMPVYGQGYRLDSR